MTRKEEKTRAKIYLYRLLIEEPAYKLTLNEVAIACLLAQDKDIQRVLSDTKNKKPTGVVR